MSSSPELAGFELRGTLHELEPDGATFEAPVTVTRRVDTEALGADLSEGIPVISLLSRSADGTWEVLADQSITLDGTTAIVSGTTTHFTTVVAFGGAAQVSMRPDNVKRKLKRGWASEVWVLATQDAAEDFTPLITGVSSSTGSADVLTVGAATVDRKSGRGTAKFTCAEVGRDSFMVTVSLSGSFGFLEFIGLPVPPGEVAKTTVTLEGKARCNAATPPPAPPPPPPPPPEPDEPSTAPQPGACEVDVLPFQDTKNELEIHFTSVPVQIAVIQPLEPPSEYIQCFSESGPCESQHGGAWTFDVSDSKSGVLYIRNNGDLPDEGEISGDFIFSDGFESGDVSSWSHSLP